MGRISLQDQLETISEAAEAGRGLSSEEINVLEMVLERRSGDPWDLFTAASAAGLALRGGAGGDGRLLDGLRAIAASATRDDSNESGRISYDEIRVVAVQAIGSGAKDASSAALMFRIAERDPSALVRMPALVAVGDLGLEHPHLRLDCARLLLKAIEFIESTQGPDPELYDAACEGAFNLLNVPLQDRPPLLRMCTPEDFRSSHRQRLRSLAR